MSLRTIARSAPRALARASTASAALSRCQRTSSSLLRARPTSFLRTQQVSAFSTSLYRRAPAGEVDEELSAKLASEIEFENDVNQNEPLPASVKDFLENSPFKVEDIPGKEDVTLTRTFGDEKITVSFSIADLHNYEPDMLEDQAMEDELDDLESGRNPQDQRGAADLAQEANEDLEAGSDEAAVPCRLNIVIEKPGKGALNVEALAQDGAIVVENLYYYADPKLAHSTDANAVHAAQETYPGPPFGSLDEDLQILMERYLEERGITQALALFAPDYMDVKEQREYMAWLKNVKSFIDA
ncbi:57533ffb-1750-4ace-bf02-ee2ad8da7cc7 [Thermothielavioides terrestris]|uniref:57533ffb-1750-4ace-bf02-ee2ad8da7cc7 n=1 Tax=Thermothielavioides terrestris TaxID=2587410 RepID=A0A3S4F1J8_9PEZI|nr:57533ffb-1750-4ace-bf02-ee2ad8da7cc7 [Thermothielavioides terrestris]